MKNEDKKLLLTLARESIQHGLENRKFDATQYTIPPKLKQKLATFVTLTLHGELRGCIGHLESTQELYKDVIENAYTAAFRDPRFPPLTRSEFENTNIEISILSESKKHEYESLPKLLQHLEQEKPGVTLKKADKQATFLPQVWEDIPDPQNFLFHLCMKAGIDPETWSDEIEIETYTVEKISEN